MLTNGIYNHLRWHTSFDVKRKNRFASCPSQNLVKGGYFVGGDVALRVFELKFLEFGIGKIADFTRAGSGTVERMVVHHNQHRVFGKGNIALNNGVRMAQSIGKSLDTIFGKSLSIAPTMRAHEGQAVGCTRKKLAELFVIFDLNVMILGIEVVYSPTNNPQTQKALQKVLTYTLHLIG
jgi:hypothetical protein